MMRVVFSSVPNDSRIVSFTNSSVEDDPRGISPPSLVDDRNIEEDIEEEESRVDMIDDDNLDRVGREFVLWFRVSNSMKEKSHNKDLACREIYYSISFMGTAFLFTENKREMDVFDVVVEKEFVVVVVLFRCFFVVFITTTV
jgi:hypothetical protein